LKERKRNAGGGGEGKKGKKGGRKVGAKKKHPALVNLLITLADNAKRKERRVSKKGGERTKEIEEKRKRGKNRGYWT